MSLDFGSLTEQQYEAVFQLCGILGLEDFSVASTILQEYNWDVNKAVDEIAFSQEKKPLPSI